MQCFFSLFFIIEEYSDHPNEVVTNEELTYNGGGAIKRRSQSYHSLMLMTTGTLLAISYLIPVLMR